MSVRSLFCHLLRERKRIARRKRARSIKRSGAFGLRQLELLEPGRLLSGSTTYNYQGVTGSERNFREDEKIEVSWYNDGTTAITFTPKVSLDDTNRFVSSPAGTWYDMGAITIQPGESGVTTFTFDASAAGDYGSVNVNSNAGSSWLIIDKIELPPVLVRINVCDRTIRVRN